MGDEAKPGLRHRTTEPVVMAPAEVELQAIGDLLSGVVTCEEQVAFHWRPISLVRRVEILRDEVLRLRDGR